MKQGKYWKKIRQKDILEEVKQQGKNICVANK